MDSNEISKPIIAQDFCVTLDFFYADNHQGGKVSWPIIQEEKRNLKKSYLVKEGGEKAIGIWENE